MAKKMKQKSEISCHFFEKKVIQGAGNTCIFFHNSCLSQHVLEGKHPSSKKDIFYPYLNLSKLKISKVPKMQSIFQHLSIKGAAKASAENDPGTLQSNIICAYSEPSRCFLTISAAPFTMANNTFPYISFLKIKKRGS